MFADSAGRIGRTQTERDQRIDAANRNAIECLTGAVPFLVDVRPAGEVIAGMKPSDLLHAGPPLENWEVVTGALRGATLGAMVHLNMARNLDEANEIASAGGIRLLSANDYGASATFAGVIGYYTPVLVVENRTSGTISCAALNEGRGKCLRYGANDPDTLQRLAWIEGEFADVLGAAVRLSGGVDLHEIVAQALHMGDDGHSRQKAASALFANAIAPYLVETSYAPKTIRRALEYLAKTDIFFLPLTMAAGKAAMQAIAHVVDCSIVTCMALNGIDFGIKVSGTGDRWFTAPVPEIHGHYFQRYDSRDANPVIGDSEIAETNGFGGFAMAAAPALARYVGGTLEESIRLSAEMYKITVAEHPRFKIPSLNYRGTPCGIDVRKVVTTEVTPIFNTGIAHKTPGFGQIGAGYGRAPIACFRTACEAIAACA